jgi:hypothetical protein
MYKFAIIGCNGYVGRNLNFILSKEHVVTSFSHSSNVEYRGINSNRENQYSLNSLIGYSNEFDSIIFLSESKHAKERESIKNYLCEILRDNYSSKIFIFSSISIFNILKTEYISFKLKIENITKSHPNVIILRPGVIYGGIPGGIYKTFLTLSKKKFLTLPCSDGVTGYVNINSISKKILAILGADEIKKSYNLVDINLSIASAFRFFGFHGLMLPIPSGIILFLFLPFLPFIKFFPSNVQSIISLSTMPKLKINEEKMLDTFIFRKFLLIDFVKINHLKNLKFSVRGFIRAIEDNNYYFQYLNMSTRQRFIFLKRLYEIYNLKNAY